MIIFLFGEDNYRSWQKLKQLKEKFIREVDPSRSSLTVLNGETVTMKQIGESIGPGTLLAKKRMIIIEDLFTNKDQTILNKVYEYLKNKKSEDNIVIFWDHSIKTKKTRNKEAPVKIDAAGRERPLTKQQSQLFKFLDKPSSAKATEDKPSAKAMAGKKAMDVKQATAGKQKYTQQFNQLSNTEATGWTKKEAEKRGGKITYQAAQLLTSLVGSDLWQINNEIDKLLSYKSGRESGTAKAVIIEVEDIEMLVRGSFDENIFALTDAISNRNKVIATKLLEEQIEAGLADAYLINMIVRQFRILLQIRQGLDSGMSSRKMINALKLHPFIVQKGINQARRFNLDSLKSILSKLVEIDFKMKTGRADAKTMLNVLIAKI